MMFLVQIAMTILIIGRPVGLSCFSCGVLSARWERVGASECACLHRLLHRPLAHSHDTLPAHSSSFPMRHSQLPTTRREGRGAGAEGDAERG